MQKLEEACAGSRVALAIARTEGATTYSFTMHGEKTDLYNMLRSALKSTNNLPGILEKAVMDHQAEKIMKRWKRESTTAAVIGKGGEA